MAAAVKTSTISGRLMNTNDGASASHPTIASMMSSVVATTAATIQ